MVQGLSLEHPVRPQPGPYIPGSYPNHGRISAKGSILDLHIHKNTMIIDNIDTQFSKMITTIQQPIFSFIQSSEERTNTGIQQVKEHLSVNQNNQAKLTTELNDFLNKYKNNSSSKGNVSEAELYYMLQSIMPSDEIIKVSSDTASCDFKVVRMDKSKPAILFENKDYSRSVTTDEVKKFERDLQVQKIHGIFISQKSPITFKNQFQIDIINGLIHIYIPNAEYDTNKIKIAIDIVDSLSIKLYAINNTSNEYSISKEDLDEILEELQMIETIRSVTKQLIDKMEDIQLPKLKKLFIKIGNIENDNDFKCTLCNSWSGKNKASLGAHIRNCKIAPKHKDINGSTENIIDIDIDLKEICIEINEPEKIEKVEIIKKPAKKK